MKYSGLAFLLFFVSCGSDPSKPKYSIELIKARKAFVGEHVTYQDREAIIVRAGQPAKTDESNVGLVLDFSDTEKVENEMTDLVVIIEDNQHLLDKFLAFKKAEKDYVESSKHD